jgi:hypothetical protein
LHSELVEIGVEEGEDAFRRIACCGRHDWECNRLRASKRDDIASLLFAAMVDDGVFSTRVAA